MLLQFFVKKNLNITYIHHYLAIHIAIGRWYKVCFFLGRGGGIILCVEFIDISTRAIFAQ